MKLSYSRLETYEKCKRKFLLEQEQQGFTNVFMQFGSKVHAAIEGALKFEPMPVFSPEEKPLAQEMIDTAVSWVGAQPVQTELRFSLDDNLKPVKWEDGAFRGIVDVLLETPQGFEIVDWKTGHVTPDRTQIMIYATAMNRMGYEVTKACYYMLRFNSITEYFVSKEDMISSATWLKSKMQEIRNEKHFDPTPSRECYYCAFVEDCPVSSVTSVTSDEDAVALLKDMEILKKKEKRAKEKIDEYIKKTGRILSYQKKQYGMKRDKNGKPFYNFL